MFTLHKHKKERSGAKTWQIRSQPKFDSGIWARRNTSYLLMTLPILAIGGEVKEDFIIQSSQRNTIAQNHYKLLPFSGGV